jgi:hypothetical protein
MSKKYSETENAIVELDKKVQEAYHLYLKFFLSLKELSESEQNEILENKFKEIIRSSLSLQDVVSCLYTVSQVAARLIGLKKSKPISDAVNEYLNAGCPCKECTEGNDRLKISSTKNSEDNFVPAVKTNKLVN